MFILSVLALFSCSGQDRSFVPPPAPAPRADLPHVVIVTLDTTRADRLGAYGYGKAITPNFDALAKEGRLYTQARSPLPLTIPAHGSIFTGKYPPSLAIRSNGGGVLSDKETTLAETFKHHGYKTGASVAAFVTTRIWGFEQGFDAYYDDIPEMDGNFWHGERPGEQVVDDALQFVEDNLEGEAPLFLWVHLYDAHFPFAPPEPFKSQQAKRPYDGEIAYVDHQLGRVRKAFEGTNALFVVVGDHGESNGDHYEVAHSMFVYDSTQHVPYVISGGGVEPGVIEEPVSLVDVAPTLLSLLKLPPLPDIDGRVAPGDAQKPQYLESYQVTERFGLAPHLAVVDGPLKLINTPRPELYDLRADPEEKKNIAGVRAKEVERLQKVLEGFGFKDPGQARVLDPAVAMQLQELGYMEPSFVGDMSGPLPDPKDHLEMIVASQRAERHRMIGDNKSSLKKLRKLAEDYPDVVEFQSRLAMTLGAMGRADESAEVLKALYEKHPDHAMVKFGAATVMARAGDYGKAAKLFREVAEKMPFSPRVRTMAVVALLEDGRGEEAMQLGSEYLQRYPDDFHLAGVMGVHLARLGNAGAAVPLLERGVLADRPERDVAYHMAAFEIGRNNTLEARHLLERELENYPRNEPARMALLRLLGMQKDWEAQVLATEHIARQEAKDPLLWHARAQALYNVTRYVEAREVLDVAMKKFEANPFLMLLDANLLSKEGHPERAKARFEEAKRAKALYDEAVKTKSKLGPRAKAKGKSKGKGKKAKR